MIDDLLELARLKSGRTSQRCEIISSQDAERLCEFFFCFSATSNEVKP
jgi:hypothetical protein